MTAPMPHTQKRLLRVVLALAAISTLATVVIVLFGLPKIFSSADNSAAVKRGSDLQACRSAYASQVTDATTAANDLVLRGLAAVGRSDEAELRLLVTDPPGANGAPIDDARALVVERNNAYLDAVQLSRDDPDAFLEACAELEPTKARTFEPAPTTTTTTTTAGTSTTQRPALTCDDLRGPILRGDPGYDPALDGDQDGVACE